MCHSRFFTVLLISILIISCNDDDSDREREEQNLNELLAEIEDLANSESCTDPSDWTYTGYGSKACGGPVGYIAYPTTIDTAAFLEKVAAHRMAQQEFNRRWDVVSNCALVDEPRAVACENGNPVFRY